MLGRTRLASRFLLSWHSWHSWHSSWAVRLSVRLSSTATKPDPREARDDAVNPGEIEHGKNDIQGSFRWTIPKLKEPRFRWGSRHTASPDAPVRRVLWPPEAQVGGESPQRRNGGDPVGETHPLPILPRGNWGLKRIEPRQSVPLPTPSTPARDESPQRVDSLAWVRRSRDEAPPRSKIIGEMQTWDFEMPTSTEPRTEKRDRTSQLESRRKESKTKDEVLPPLDHNFREWLITAVEEAISDADKNRTGRDIPAVYNGPTVLVLNAASRSLLESDFYRLAGQGKHLQDWAVGIARIIQARDPTTYEPLGKYYIFFYTRAAALAYEEEVVRLHLQSRRAAHLLSTSLSSSSDNTPGPLPLAPNLASDPGAEFERDAALRGYTLVPHSARLDLQLYLCKDLPIPDEDPLSRINAHLAASSSTSPAGTPSLHRDHHFVLISLEGCKTTVAALHDAIARDGEQRRLPWAIGARSDGKPSIAAVKPGEGWAPERQPWYFRPPKEDPGGRFWRFLVPFAEAAEARRFVRNWHRREMQDLEGRNMVVTFNVTALW